MSCWEPAGLGLKENQSHLNPSLNPFLALEVGRIPNKSRAVNAITNPYTNLPGPTPTRQSPTSYPLTLCPFTPLPPKPSATQNPPNRLKNAPVHFHPSSSPNIPLPSPSPRPNRRTKTAQPACNNEHHFPSLFPFPQLFVFFSYTVVNSTFPATPLKAHYLISLPRTSIFLGLLWSAQPSPPQPSLA